MLGLTVGAVSPVFLDHPAYPNYLLPDVFQAAEFLSIANYVPRAEMRFSNIQLFVRTIDSRR